MSELGSKKGQSENKNAPVFDSSELETKQKTDHFVNGELADKRQTALKQAEKAKERQTKDARKAEFRAELKAQKKQEAEAKKTNNKIVYVLFWGWHKFITILIVAGILLTVFLIANNTSTKQNNDTSLEKAEERIATFEMDCVSEDEESGYCSNSLDEFEEYIKQESNTEAKVRLLSEYEKYVMKEYGDSGRAKTFLDENIPSGYDEQQREILCQAYSDLYYSSNNWEEYVKDCKL